MSEPRVRAASPMELEALDECVRLRNRIAELEAELARVNKPFTDDLDPRITITKRDRFYVYEIPAGECGPYRTWGEAYLAAESHLVTAELAALKRLREDSER